MIVTFTLVRGECSELLRQMADNSVHALVTDPPCGISFMGKDWDKNKGGRDGWVEWLTGIMKECMRVLKPGGHALVWSLPRTSHWTGMAIENAGFEIRDRISHVFGTGFPKSRNVSKDLDRMLGAKRGKIRDYHPRNPKSINGGHGVDGGDRPWMKKARERGYHERDDDTPITDEAKKWDGYGTGLKPAHEDWILAFKPLSEKSRARQVLATGTGVINIDGCRVGAQGRFPPNLVSTEIAIAEYFPLFKYQTKPSAAERDAGLTTPKKEIVFNGQAAKACASNSVKGSVNNRFTSSHRNIHPTVKPIELMRWLCRLVTPKGGIVLDPFMGSGTTGCACMIEGFRFIGIEQNLEYFEIAKQRIEYWQAHRRGQLKLWP